jgi:dihydroorotate dehydrogenase (fumarate)
MDLTTNYLGLSLRSPLVPSASPLSEKIENIRQMAQSGIPADLRNNFCCEDWRG